MLKELGLEVGYLERHLTVGSTGRYAAHIAALRRVSDELGAASSFLALLANGVEGAVEKVRNLVGVQPPTSLHRCIDEQVAKSTFNIAEFGLHYVSGSREVNARRSVSEENALQKRHDSVLHQAERAVTIVWDRWCYEYPLNFRKR
jgi:hypothetical protein